MTFFSILGTLLISPLKLVFEIIFQYAHRLIGHPGFAICVLSLVMNILVLPLYRRADAMQEQARDVEEKLREGTAHIKKTFSGDERMMILQTYQRQNHYKPTHVFKGSVSLLLEIPFFMAAYQFLAHLETLKGVSFGPIADLGAPDAILHIGGITLNLLPILMTLINVISSAIYLRGFPLKTKIQLYAMAAFFLVFLYTSPSGLVFYWTLNNVFSLVKNIFYKIPNPQRVLRILTFVLGIGAFVLAQNYLVARKPLIVIGIVLLMPLLSHFASKFFPRKQASKEPKPNRKAFTAGALFLAFFTGLLIPSTFIAASPQEYVDVTYFYHPLWYIAYSLCLAVGTFVVWMGVFYWLANAKWKVIFERLMFVASGAVVVNYMFFGTDLGVISPTLVYEEPMLFTAEEKWVNLAVLLAIGIVLFFLASKWKNITVTVLTTAILAVTVMSGLNVVTTAQSVAKIKVSEMETIPQFQLSKEGKNVVVLMLDRAVAEYIPSILAEKPELKEAFDGFTYYRNTISFGGHTNIGVPALVGGYEYTPVELNRRSEETMVEKHNEALKVMPVLFDQNDFEVTVCDAPYANYQWIPDMSIYDEYPEINTYITKGAFGDVAPKIQTITSNQRNFFCFSLMKSMPLFLQRILYNDGAYNQAISSYEATVQSWQDASHAQGISKNFMEAYNVLQNLSTMSQITEEGNTFLFLANDTAHEITLLQTPDYTPSAEVDNAAYDEQMKERFEQNGVKLTVDSALNMSHYHANMAAYLQLAQWFDFLREQDLYDNTRIILVSDHAYNLFQDETMTFGEEDMSQYFPLLMVKDFDSTGFEVSDEFMTNADVPTLAAQGLIKDPKNPFTGKAISNSEKTAHEQYICLSHDWAVEENPDSKTFAACQWVAIKDDLRDRNQWSYLETLTILAEHSLPQ